MSWHLWNSESPSAGAADDAIYRVSPISSGKERGAIIEGFYAVDYQVHSYRSHDGRASIAEQCARAVEIGLDEIGFSEHKDFDPADPAVDYFDYDATMREIEAERKRWGNRLKIRAGVEVDYQVWFEDRIARYLDAHPFDFVIGSVHYVQSVMLMTEAYNRTRDKRQAYRDYFQAVRDSVASGLFDILGHLEYANRRGLAAWGSYDPHEYEPELNALFDLMIARGLTFEINTAGLHQGLGVTYPAAETVAMYAARGGSLLSLGSDAHHPDQLAHAYGTAARLALDNGLTHVCTWENRQRTRVPLVRDGR
ncbi:MAG TPA: histidinol-phosphatase HisJ family protein [Chthonomonadaceae bacterium]|nr:histidinol-phosphatase HisJ family protein [Chthonomonadaceae bacterium]